MEAFNYIAIGISIAGSIIIIWGVLITVFNFLVNEKSKIAGAKSTGIIETARHQFSVYLI